MRKGSSISPKKTSKVAPNKKEKSPSKTKEKVSALTTIFGDMKPQNYFETNPTRPSLISKGGSGNSCYFTVRAPSSEEEEDRIYCEVTYAPQSDPTDKTIFPNGDGDIGDPFSGMPLTATGLAAGTYVIHAHAEYDGRDPVESPSPDLTITVP
jgi:hypothetical protein